MITIIFYDTNQSAYGDFLTPRKASLGKSHEWATTSREDGDASGSKWKRREVNCWRSSKEGNPYLNCHAHGLMMTPAFFLSETGRTQM